jgi:hypothetical protein
LRKLVVVVIIVGLCVKLLSRASLSPHSFHYRAVFSLVKACHITHQRL